jgi:hypothetical protein
MTLLALVAGCGTILSTRAAKVADADEASIASCQFVGEVQGSTGSGSLATSAELENARNEARKQAAKLGATDIVWKSISAGYSPYVSGLAYVCSPSRR